MKDRATLIVIKKDIALWELQNNLQEGSCWRIVSDDTNVPNYKAVAFIDFLMSLTIYIFFNITQQ